MLHLLHISYLIFASRATTASCLRVLELQKTVKLVVVWCNQGSLSGHSASIRRYAILRSVMSFSTAKVASVVRSER